MDSRLASGNAAPHMLQKRALIAIVGFTGSTLNHRSSCMRESSLSAIPWRAAVPPRVRNDCALTRCLTYIVWNVNTTFPSRTWSPLFNGCGTPGFTFWLFTKVKLVLFRSSTAHW